jgi:hypothetical protein
MDYIKNGKISQILLFRRALSGTFIGMIVLVYFPNLLSKNAENF